MPVREESLVPPIDQGTDSIFLCVSKQLLRIISSIKGISLMLGDARGPEHSRPDEKTKRAIMALLKLILSFTATSRRTTKAFDDAAEQDKRAHSEDVGEKHEEKEQTLEELQGSVEATDGDHDSSLDRPSELAMELSKIANLNGVLDCATDEACREALRKMLLLARDVRSSYDVRDTKLRRREMKKVLNDPSQGFNRFFKSLRADQMRPTSVLKVGEKLTGNMNDIFEAFEEQWKGVYNRLANSPPCFDEFTANYDQYMVAEPTGYLIPDGFQLRTAAARARADAAAGRDAWRPAELALLPVDAWHERAKLLKLCASKGAWPSAYREVSSPCLQKKDKLDPDSGRDPPTVLDHRLLSVYTQLYRIEMGAWCRNHAEWLAKTIHKGCCGAMAGREPSEASWDAQAAIAAAMEQGEEKIVAMLDYYKFFDSFEPRFYAFFL